MQSKSPRLLIISHTPHYLSDGVPVGWGPTVREIDYLSTMLTITHLAPLHQETAPHDALPYASKSVSLRFVKPSGGSTLWSKMEILLTWFQYASVIIDELGKADILHIRCPANISLLSLLLLLLPVKAPRKRWIKYAGSWLGEKNEAISYKFQRWWLKHPSWHQAYVSINGATSTQDSYIRSFINPSVSNEELAAGLEIAQQKTLTSPIQLLFVGLISSAKGLSTLISVIHALHKTLDCRLDIVGDGPDRALFEKMVDSMQLRGIIRFHGAVPRHRVTEFYSNAHFILLPSFTEGWPKVLSEAMAFGVVPIASNVGSIPYFFQKYQLSDFHDPTDIRAFVESIKKYSENPDLWQVAKEKGLQLARDFSDDAYLQDVQTMLSLG